MHEKYMAFNRPPYKKTMVSHLDTLLVPETTWHRMKIGASMYVHTRSYLQSVR